MKWNIKNGKRWMIQWGWPILFSMGIHIHVRFKFIPLWKGIGFWKPSFNYVDFHLIFIIITIGRSDWEYDEYRTWWASRSIK